MVSLQEFRESCSEEDYARILKVFKNEDWLKVFLKPISKHSGGFVVEKKFIFGREKELKIFLKKKEKNET